MAPPLWGIAAFAALTGASPQQALPPAETLEVSEPLDLMSAVRASDVAEIFIVSRILEFPMRLRPEMVRSSGCKYRVYRDSPQWRELERALAGADVDIVPADSSGEVRVGLVLGDARGTVQEIYSNDLAWPSGNMAGLAQRRQVEISPGFVTALLGFVERNPDLALPSARCPRERGR